MNILRPIFFLIWRQVAVIQNTHTHTYELIVSIRICIIFFAAHKCTNVCVCVAVALIKRVPPTYGTRLYLI